MKEHYDLVILGATPEGLYAAQQALKIKGKRVALVTQGINPEASLASTYFYAYLQQFLTQQTQLKLWQSFQPDFPGSLNTQDLIRVSQELSELAVQQDSRLDNLSIQGLDIIDAKGAFLHPTKRKRAVFEVENRLLRSRFYLVTVPKEPLFNRETLFEGHHYGILGSNSEALTWAYFLAKLGKSVTVITPSSDIFPQEDAEIIQTLRAYLEGLSIQFLTSINPANFAVKLVLQSETNSPYLNYHLQSLILDLPDDLLFKETGEEKPKTGNERLVKFQEVLEALLILWLAIYQKSYNQKRQNLEKQIAEVLDLTTSILAYYPFVKRTIFREKLAQCDQILDCRRPSLPTDWGFDKLNLCQEPTGIWVNAFLRTSHPQLYAIGGAIAGYSSLELAQQEADCVIQNTLLGRKKLVNYAQYSYSLLTYPYLGRYGLTTAQARQYYGDCISVTTHWLHLPSTILGDDWGSGYHCIWKDEQQLVGAYYWGERTRDFIQLQSLSYAKLISRKLQFPK